MNRLRLAWHVLRGRPLVYGVDLAGGIQLQETAEKTVIAHCTIVGTAPPVPSAALTLGRW